MNNRHISIDGTVRGTNRRNNNRSGRNNRRRRNRNGGGGRHGRPRLHAPRIGRRSITGRIGRALTHLARNGGNIGGNTGCHGSGHRTITRHVRTRRRTRRTRSGMLGLARFMATGRLTIVVGIPMARVVRAYFGLNLFISVGRHVSTRAVGVITSRFNFGARFISTRIIGTVARRTSTRRSLRPHTPVIAIVNRISRNGASLLSCVHGSGIVTNRTNNVARRVKTCGMALSSNHRVAFLSAPNRRTFATVHTHNTRMASVTVVVITTSSGIVPRAVRTVGRTSTTNIPVMFTVGGISGPATGPSGVGRALTSVGCLIRR